MSTISDTLPDVFVTGSGTATDLKMCQHCGLLPHIGLCPKIKAIEYHQNGTIKRVEYHGPEQPAFVPGVVLDSPAYTGTEYL